MDLIKLNCLICLSQTFGFNLLQETKYEGMNIEELFFHLKIAIINMGTKETVLAITDLDWDSFVLNHLESEKLDFSLSETCFFWKTIF